MKKLVAILAVLVVIVAVIMGAQIVQKNNLSNELRVESAALMEQSSRMQTSLDQVRLDFAAAQSELDAQKTAAQTLALQNEATLAELETAKTGMAESSAALSQAQQDLLAVRTELEVQQANAQTLAAEKEAIKAELETALMNVQDAGTALAQQTATQEALTLDRDALRSDRDGITQKLADAQAQVTALTQEKGALATQLAESRGRIEELTLTATTLESAQADLMTQNAQALLAQTELQVQYDALGANHDAAQLQIDELTAQADTLTQAYTALRGDYDAAQAKVNELSGRVTALNTEKAALEEMQKADKAEAEKLQTGLQAQYDELKTELDTFRATALVAAATPQPQPTLALEHGSTALADIPPAEEATLSPMPTAVAVVSEMPAAKVLSLTIFHTNDVHSRVQGDEQAMIGYAKLATIVKEAREKGPVLLLDAGDVLHGMSFATMVEGKSIVDLMNLLGYDAMTPGNHDFNYGFEQLKSLEAGMNFPLLDANITLDSGENAFTPYVIKDIEGKKIALIGAANPQIKSAIHPEHIGGLVFGDDKAVAQAVADMIAVEAPDAVILLAHWGADGAYQPNSSVLASIPGVDLVIDGHSHTQYEDIQQTQGAAPIVSAGEYMKNIGRVVMTIDEQNSVSVQVEHILFEDTVAVEPHQEVLQFIQETSEGQADILSTVVGTADVALDGERETNRTGETNLGNLAADVLREQMDADFAFTNGGGIRKSVAVGDITKGDLLDVFPFGNSIVLIEVTGANLLAAMENGLKLYPEQSGGFPQISGGTLVFDPAKEPGSRVVAFAIGGEPVEPDKVYLTATNDFTAAGGDSYTMLSDSPVVRYGGTLDEALIAHIIDIGMVSREVEGRIKTVDAP